MGRTPYAPARKIRGNYIGIYKLDHPRSTPKTPYVYEHVLIIEKALGKYLPKKADTHHVDGNGLNNENTNLVACEDHAYHMLLHRRTEAIKACGHATWRRCKYCHNWDNPDNLFIKENKVNGDICWHRGCHNKSMREYRLSWEEISK